MDILTAHYSSFAFLGNFHSFYFRNFHDVIFWQPLLGHPDGQFSIMGNQIFTKFGILLYLDTLTHPDTHAKKDHDLDSLSLGDFALVLSIEDMWRGASAKRYYSDCHERFSRTVFRCFPFTQGIMIKLKGDANDYDGRGFLVDIWSSDPLSIKGVHFQSWQECHHWKCLASVGLRNCCWAICSAPMLLLWVVVIMAMRWMMRIGNWVNQWWSNVARLMQLFA